MIKRRRGTSIADHELYTGGSTCVPSSSVIGSNCSVGGCWPSVLESGLRPLGRPLACLPPLRLGVPRGTAPLRGISNSHRALFQLGGFVAIVFYRSLLQVADKMKPDLRVESCARATAVRSARVIHTRECANLALPIAMRGCCQKLS